MPIIYIYIYIYILYLQHKHYLQNVTLHNLQCLHYLQHRTHYIFFIHRKKKKSYNYNYLATNNLS